MMHHVEEPRYWIVPPAFLKGLSDDADDFCLFDAEKGHVTSPRILRSKPISMRFHHDDLLDWLRGKISRRHK